MRANIFVRRVLLLLSGSVAAQALLLAVTPILSRIYSPEQMGILGVFVAFVGMVGTLVTLRYENAILLPREENEAAGIVCVVVLNATIISLLLAATLAIGGNRTLELMGAESLSDYFLWMAVGTCLMGIMQGLNSWLIRRAQFRQLTFARISQSAATALSQLVAGFAGFSAIGLVWGQLLGQLAGVCAMMVALIACADVKSFASVSIADLRRLGKRYIRFPLYSLPADALNALASYLPFFILGKYFGPVVVGLYFMMQRMTLAPIALVANAVSDVFKERATRDFREVGTCRPLLIKTFLGLFAISLPLSLLLFFFGPQLFSFVLGDKWNEAGGYASIMAPLVAIRFAISPVGFVLYVAEKQNVDLFWQGALLVVNSASLFAGAALGDAKLSVTLFSFSYSTMYLIYLALSYYYGKSDSFPQERGNGK